MSPECYHRDLPNATPSNKYCQENTMTVGTPGRGNAFVSTSTGFDGQPHLYSDNRDWPSKPHEVDLNALPLPEVPTIVVFS